MPADWLQLPDGQLLAVANIRRVEQLPRAIRFTLADGTILTPTVTDSTQAATFFTNVKAALPNVTAVGPSSATITSISPISGAQNGDVTITFTGTNFDPNGSLGVSNVPIGYQYTNSTTAAGILSGFSLPVGTYDVFYYNPDGTVGATLAGAYTVT